MNTTFYRCCFCNELIQSSNSDPCEIDILINIDKPKNKQYNQIFYCHMRCFKEKLHEKIRIHFALEYLIPSDSDDE
jgi:hypothetical protein